MSLLTNCFNKHSELLPYYIIIVSLVNRLWLSVITILINWLLTNYIIIIIPTYYSIPIQKKIIIEIIKCNLNLNPGNIYITFVQWLFH